ncbi:Rho1 guanine nucleotide exchange factor 1 [Choanephora cucurbitarum]|uniref:Rho1 guanine nucleotide exchange factor 1 n=1 Tax=Choanephora cucurbitarum TaxID=101091 RepID=A0A1C7N4W9_9FUNG|nr:Rho1 guanine nucleotide exchange factor 1 [Choanephora cucurbitarum]
MQDCLNTLMNDADPYVDEIDQHCNVTTPARSSSLQAPQKPPSQALRSNTVHSYQYFNKRSEGTNHPYTRYHGPLHHAYSSSSYQSYRNTPPTPPFKTTLRSPRSTSTMLVEPKKSNTDFFATQTHLDYVNTYLKDSQRLQEKTLAYDEDDDASSVSRSSSIAQASHKHSSGPFSESRQFANLSSTKPTVITATARSSSSSIISPSHTPPIISIPPDYAYMSVLSNAFVRRIRSLEHVRELFCANEYPESFTGQEAIRILQYLLDGLPEAYCITIANALMKATPSLFDPIHYSQKSIIQSAFYNSPDEYYTLHEDSEKVPSGLFTGLLECYSYSCSPGKGGCYAPRCSNKPELFEYEYNTQDSSLLVVSPTLRYQPASSENTEAKTTQHIAWAQKVPKSLLKTLSKREIARQEAINEIIYSEAVYKRDLEILSEHIIKPIRDKSSIILSSRRREEFVQEVFGNYKQLLEASTALFNDLVNAQQQHENACIPMIGDVLIKHYAYFEDPFTRYCPHISLSEYLIKEEAKSNPNFEKFIAQVEKSKRMRRLAFRHFLLNPVTRLQRYPLLLDAILKSTDLDHPDYAYLTRCLDMVKKVASKSDALADVFKKRVQILEIHDSIRFKPGEYQDLRLTDPQRKLYYQGDIKRRSSGITEVSERSEIRIFIFDHLMLLTKPRKLSTTNSAEECRVWKRPIPLQMLYVNQLPTKLTHSSTSSSLRSYNQASLLVPFTFQHLGQRGGTYTFMCTSDEKQKWLVAIEEAKASLKKRTGEDAFEVVSIDDTTFSYVAANVSKHAKVTCTAPFTSISNEDKLAVGTGTGVYIINIKHNVVKKVLSIESVMQILILKKHHILVVLADKTLKAYPLDLLDAVNTSGKPLERLGQELAQHVHYFQVGVCNNRDLLIYKKKKNTSSVFTALEPMYDLRDPRNQKYIVPKTGFMMGSRSSHAWFKKYKEFYVGAESSNIQFLKSKLLVVCARGFEIIDPENLSVGGRDIPDKMDPQFNFVHRQIEAVKPIAMYRVHDKFLLCYSKFAFYVNNRNGSLIYRGPQRLPLLCEWEGTPEYIVYQHPYVIAFDPQFIEIRYVDTGDLVQIIPGEQIRLTHFASNTTQDMCIYGCQTHLKRPELQNVFYLKLQKNTNVRKFVQ